MDKVITLVRRTDLPERYFGTLPEPAIRQVLTLSSQYGVYPGAFYVPLRDEEHREVAIGNLAGLLGQPAARRLLYAARDGPFSREDKVSPERRFAAALEMIATEVVNSYRTPQDFSMFADTAMLLVRLAAYSRNRKSATPDSQQVRRSLKELLRTYHKDFGRLGTAPLLYGSLLYGDARRDSDIDLLFPFLEDGGIREEQCDLIHNIETAINENIPEHPFKDINTADDVSVDILQLQGMLTDIIEGEATCVEDYVFGKVDKKGRFNKNDLFYGHHLLIEGQLLVVDDDIEIALQTKDAQQRLREAASKDPFFDFLLAYKLWGSVMKREEHLR